MDHRPLPYKLLQATSRLPVSRRIVDSISKLLDRDHFPEFHLGHEGGPRYDPVVLVFPDGVRYVSIVRRDVGLTVRYDHLSLSRFTRVRLKSHVERKIAMFPRTNVQNGETNRLTVL